MPVELSSETISEGVLSGSMVALVLGIVFIGPLDGNINSQQMKCVTDEKPGGVVNHAGNRAVVQPVINLVVRWNYSNQMHFNASKYNIIPL